MASNSAPPRWAGRVCVQPHEHARNHGLPHDAPLLRPLAIVLKKSLTEIPLVGPAALHVGCIPVTRKNAREDLKTVLEVGSQRLAAGHSVLLFPQGTRQRSSTARNSTRWARSSPNAPAFRWCRWRSDGLPQNRQMDQRFRRGRSQQADPLRLRAVRLPRSARAPARPECRVHRVEVGRMGPALQEASGCLRLWLIRRWRPRRRPAAARTILRCRHS
jgi:1-acyl-sn-glycerol-3-phosphate acyltransferase